MIHIDHSLLDNSPPSPPRPALPILASHLLELEEKQRKRFSKKGGAERLSTGCREIDEVLGGSVERGVVLGISAGVEGREARLLSLHLLASVLLPNLISPTNGHSPQFPQAPAKTKATIIDTTGSFPIALLASVLKSRLLAIQSQTAQNAVKTGNYAVQEAGKNESVRREESAGIDEQVQKCLEMVAISRVFDVEGLWEVIGEVDQVDSVAQDHDSRQGNGNEREKSGGASEGETVVEQAKANDEPEILDSDEELTPPILPAVLDDQEVETGNDEGTEIIIVDNMTHIINELFARKEKSDAHTLLTLLCSTLHTLSKTSNILTILHNTTHPSNNTSYPSAQNPHSNQNQNQTQNRNLNALHASTSRSIFASASTKPALGQIFAQFPDLHMFLHQLPKSRRDAEILYGGSGEDVFAPAGEEYTNRDAFGNSGGERNTSVNYTTILEVLKDEAPLLSLSGDSIMKEKGVKFAHREQKWTAISISPDGLDLVGAFAERGGMKGMGMSRERGGTRIDEGLSGGVGNVAKVWGFGGRRV